MNLLPVKPSLHETLGGYVALVLVGGLLVSVSGTQIHGSSSAAPGSGAVNGGATTTYAVIKVISIGADPLAIAVNDSDDTIYVAENGSSSVSIISGHTGSSSGGITVNRPSGVAVHQADDTVYISETDKNRLVVVEGATSAIHSTIGVGLTPTAVAVNQIDDTVYVTNFGSASVSVINGRTATRTDDTIYVGTEPNSIAVKETDDTIYVGNSVLPNGGVSVINGRTAQRTDDTIAGNGARAVAINQSDDTVYIGFSAHPQLTVVNARTLTRTHLSLDNSVNGVAVDQRDDTFYVATGNQVSIRDGRTYQLIANVAVPGATNIAIDQEGTNQGLIYVTNFTSLGQLSTLARVTLAGISASGVQDDTVAFELSVADLASGFVMDDSTISSVTFGGNTATVTRGSGNTWVAHAPAGTGTVDITIGYRGGLTAVAGTFTYQEPPAPDPVPVPVVTVPSAPISVLGEPANSSVALSWQEPSSSGSFPITNYEAVVTPGGQSCLVSAPTLTCTITGLTNETAYSATVRALNGAGWSAFSQPSPVFVPHAAPGPDPTLLITGSRAQVNGRSGVMVMGSSTGLTSSTVRARVRLSGQVGYRNGASRAIDSEGNFAWQRATNRSVSVYFIADQDSLRSNRVVIPARR